ncbi:hypothetical protein SPI_06695 [Niveomyces insectorum RCEF 264]|uniref:HNH nuclease domain-containing protein n=1 Tax=Niveomyces insectorum RCEF 264 TaxID=1081102 RepID=A0A167RI47_9HYPO|nr:hypothetical protein SPI_06695 [Niveomyces insectorum RCEF 264]
MDGATKAQLREATDRFLDVASTHSADIAQLERYLAMRPEMAPVHDALPADEVAERLSFARRIEKDLQDFVSPQSQLSSFSMSVMFNLPLHILRTLSSDDYGSLELSTESMVRIFLQKPENDDDAKKNTAGGSDNKHDDGAARRTAAEVAKCLKRDGGRCLLLGTANPAMHTWWAEGHFALKCLGITPVLPGGGEARVSIQFHWMPLHRQVAPRTPGTSKAAADDYVWRQPVLLDDGQGEAWVADSMNRPRCGGQFPASGDASLVDDGVVAVAYPCTGRPLRTGAVFHTGAMPMEEATQMRGVLDVQWACIQIACMSGAAGSPEFLTEWDVASDDDDDGNLAGSPSHLSESEWEAEGKGKGKASAMVPPGSDSGKPGPDDAGKNSEDGKHGKDNARDNDRSDNDGYDPGRPGPQCAQDPVATDDVG